MTNNIMFDYRDLLKKYIDHVSYQEGIDFVTNRRWCEVYPFSEEEMKELQKLAGEVYLELENKNG